MESQADKEITQIKGGGEGAAKLINAAASAKAASRVINATTDAYLALDSNCNFNPQNNLD